MIFKNLHCNKIIIITTFGSLSILTFLCYWVHGHLLEESKLKYCDTDACIKTANYIITNMNKSVDPCENFYRFACGSFVNKTILEDNRIMVNTFTRLENILRNELKDTIIKNVVIDKEPRIFDKLRQYYKVCVNDNEEYDPNKKNLLGTQEIAYLKILNELGGWPVLVGDSWNATNFSWNKTIAQLHRTFGLANEFIINYEVAVDKKNNSIKHINIAPGSLGLADVYLNKGLEHKNVKAYYSYMVDVAVFFGANRSRAEKEFTECLTFEMKLANITLNATEKNVFLKTREPISITELQAKYPYIQWYSYLDNVLYPNVILNKTEEVIVLAPVYFEKLGIILDETSNKVLANFIFWSTTKLMLHFLSKRTRDIEHAYNTLFMRNVTITPRWEICFNQVLTYFPLAMGSLYVRTHIDSSTKGHVQEIFSAIHETFTKMIQEIEWMDNSTKKAALNKLNLMNALISHPEELFDNEKIDKYYEKVTIDSTSYFKTVINLNIFYVENSFRSLRKRVQKIDWTDFGAAATINAFYKLQSNIIIVPSGILQDFLYQTERPRFINYATMGSVIGHEMTHAFDNVGRFFDANGNKVDWWTNKTEKEFLERTKCFVEQYSNYTVEEVQTNVNGGNTLGENIADNAGLKKAYRAYTNWLDKTGVKEPRLRRLEEYTPKQMFWIAFANTWCEKSRLEYLNSTVLYDPHAPNEFRVIGTLSNSAEFAQDFYCSANSRMNPIEKCSIW